MRANKTIRSVITLAVVFAVLFISSSCAVKKLDTPKNLQFTDRVLSWEPVDGAVEYIVNLNGKHYATTTECSLPPIIELTEGDYTFDVKAIAGGKKTEDSSYTSTTFSLDTPVESGYDENGYYYTLLEDRTGYEITRGSQKLPKGTLRIPDFFNGYPVLSIGEKGFADVVWPVVVPGVRIAQWYDTFTHNYNITEIVFPKYLKTVKKRAFAYNSAVESITLPSTVTELVEESFSPMLNLRHLDLGKATGLKEIPDSCFRNVGIEELILPPNLEVLGPGCFWLDIRDPETFRYNDGYEIEKFDDLLTTVVMPEPLNYMSGGAFCHRESIETVIWPENCLVELGGLAESKWIKNLPSGEYMVGSVMITYIDDPNLPNGSVDYVVPDYVTHIKNLAASNLRSIYIPDGVSIERAQGQYFEHIRLPADKTEYEPKFFSGTTSLKTVELPYGTTAISEDMFYYSGIESITLPDSITEIRKNSFTRSNLESIVFSKNLKVIHPSSFNYTKLKSIDLPDSLEVIGESAFSQSLLTDISIPEGVKEIGKHAFYASTLKYAILPTSLESVENPFGNLSSINGRNAMAEFEYVFFRGTPKQWSDMCDKNPSLKDIELYEVAEVCYFSETQPLIEGSFWHYDQFGKPVKW